MKIKLDKGAIMPTRAHKDDAGLDLYAPSNMPDARLLAGSSVVIDTGVHAEIPKGYVGFLKSKSGMNVNYGILNEGVIDAGYTGSIKVKLYNFGCANRYIRARDKISQLVILPILTPDIELVDELDETERGNNGFGSTGR